MSSLVEVTDIGADYWLQEARTGVIKPIPEVFVPGMDDLQTRFDNLSMAYADLSNEKTILLEQLEAERHQSQQLQMQLEEQRRSLRIRFSYSDNTFERHFTYRLRFWNFPPTASTPNMVVCVKTFNNQSTKLTYLPSIVIH